MLASTAHPVPEEVLPSAQPVAELLADMLRDYALRDSVQVFPDWLADTLVECGGMNPQTASETANSIVSYLQGSHQLHGDLHQHLVRGKSRSSWIANQVDKVAQDTQSNHAEVAVLSALLAGQVPTDGRTSPLPLPDWNDISRITLAQSIDLQYQQQAALNVLDERARDWASQLADDALKNHPDTAALAQKFIRGELDADSAVTLQAVLAAGTELAGRKGFLGAQIKEVIENGTLTPQWCAHNTFISTENAQVLYALGTGQLDANEALDQMADIAAAAAAQALREVCRQAGGVKGAALVMWIPMIGPFLAPAGRYVGEAVGAWVGDVAGSVVGTAIRTGVSSIKSAASSAVSAIGRVGQAAWSGVKSVGSFVSSVFRW